jgi:hypothetical protein
MYVRFITPWWPVRRGIDCGVFGPAGAFAHACGGAGGGYAHVEAGGAVRAALRAELNWFNANLPVPRRRAFQVKSCRAWRDDGICWFADDAREMIAHAFTLAALLGECGVPVRKVATARPGTILYRDDWQIVAKPEAATPTVWH